MKNYRQKSKTKNIITIIIIALLLTSVAGLFVILNKPEAAKGYELANADFSIGSLDTTTGRYAKSDGSLYTKDAFDCEAGVKIELDFDSNIKWKVFFYDDIDSFVSCSEEFDVTNEVEAPATATRARIMIIPIWDNEIDKDDQTIKWYSINKYAKQLTVSVEKIVEDAE